MNKIPAPIHPHEMLTAKASEAAKKVFEDLLDKVGSLRLFTTFCEKKRQLLFSEIITWNPEMDGLFARVSFSKGSCSGSMLLFRV